MSGVIQGGWEFVIAAFAISAAVLVVYTISIVARIRSAKEESPGE